MFLPATAMHEAGKFELLNLTEGFPAKRTLLVTAISRCQKTSHPNLNHETHERPRKARNAFVCFALFRAVRVPNRPAQPLSRWQEVGLKKGGRCSTIVAGEGD
jgi:hypothetical protein